MARAPGGAVPCPRGKGIRDGTDAKKKTVMGLTVFFLGILR